jgi:hypothetical protein
LLLKRRSCCSRSRLLLLLLLHLPLLCRQLINRLDDLLLLRCRGVGLMQQHQ